MFLLRQSFFLFPAFYLLLMMAGCPSDVGGVPPVDDDDLSDDDDDSFTGETASYPEEEQFLGLALGNTWRYDEVVSGGPAVEEDDVLVEIVDRIAGPALNPPKSNTVVAFEFELDRLFGRDESHWYSLDGSGTMRWVKSSVTQNFFDTTDFEGDGSIVMWTAADELGVIGSSMEASWFLADIEGLDFSAEASTVETFMYGEGQEVETVGLVVSEAGVMVGLQYFKPAWGILGMSVALGSQSIEWTVVECSICPASAGL